MPPISFYKIVVCFYKARKVYSFLVMGFIQCFLAMCAIDKFTQKGKITSTLTNVSNHN